ncbi:MAG: hypothetical protein RIS76_3554 [Verrucomicrobiota bacterium]|jgi:hypothetical protein
MGSEPATVGLMSDSLTPPVVEPLLPVRYRVEFCTHGFGNEAADGFESGAPLYPIHVGDRIDPQGWTRSPR